MLAHPEGSLCNLSHVLIVEVPTNSHHGACTVLFLFWPVHCHRFLASRLNCIAAMAFPFGAGSNVRSLAEQMRKSSDKEEDSSGNATSEPVPPSAPAGKLNAGRDGESLSDPSEPAV